MSYDPTKDDYEYNENLSPDENRANMRARSDYLSQWAKDNWTTSCHAAGAEARAQWLESCCYNDDDNLDIQENDGWNMVENFLEDYAMVDTMNAWVEAGTIYAKSPYGWMLDAVGYDIPGVMSYVKDWCDDKWTDYDKMDALKKVIAKDWYDMWDEED